MRVGLMLAMLPLISLPISPMTTAEPALAIELPEEVAAARCKGKKKVFGFVEDPGASPSVRKFKMKNAFYVVAGSAYVQGCRAFRGQNACQETLGIGLFLPSGFTGEASCGSQSGLPYVTYGTASGAGLPDAYWSATTCTVTVVKNDEKHGRLKGMLRAEILGGDGPTPRTGHLVACFKARRQDLGN